MVRKPAQSSCTCARALRNASPYFRAFTSPTPDQIYEGIKAIATDKGVLMVIKNYTGDVMNFEMAGEMAQMDDIKVAQVVVNDDVAVDGSLYTVGRRCGSWSDLYALRCPSGTSCPHRYPADRRSPWYTTM